MPFKCCVKNCRGEKVKFSFPNEDNQQQKWLKILGRMDIVNKDMKNYKVCELHFKKCDVMKTSQIVSRETGQLLEVPLERPRLLKGAIPIPYSASSQKVSLKRLPPKTKRQKLKCQSFQSAVIDGTDGSDMSTASNETENEMIWKKRTIDNIDDIVDYLKENVPTSWSFSKKKNAILLFLTDNECKNPEMKCALRISNNFEITLFHGKVQEDVVKMFSPVQNTIQLEAALKYIEELLKKTEEKSTAEKIIIIKNHIGNLLEDLQPESHAVVESILEQLDLLRIKENR